MANQTQHSTKMSEDTPRKRGGRPQKSAAEKKQYRFTIKLCTAEKFDLLGKAKQAGITPVEYIRQAISSSVVKERMTPELAAFRRDISGMKNNLNQTAHIANRDGYAMAAQMNRQLALRLDAILKRFGL